MEIIIILSILTLISLFYNSCKSKFGFNDILLTLKLCLSTILTTIETPLTSPGDRMCLLKCFVKTYSYSIIQTQPGSLSPSHCIYIL